MDTLWWILFFNVYFLKLCLACPQTVDGGTAWFYSHTLVLRMNLRIFFVFFREIREIVREIRASAKICIKLGVFYFFLVKKQILHFWSRRCHSQSNQLLVVSVHYLHVLFDSFTWPIALWLELMTTQGEYSLPLWNRVRNYSIAQHLIHNFHLILWVLMVAGCWNTLKAVG